jgi:hypothetical protein
LLSFRLFVGGARENVVELVEHTPSSDSPHLLELDFHELFDDFHGHTDRATAFLKQVTALTLLE